MPDTHSTIEYPSTGKRIFKAIAWLLMGNTSQKRRVRQELARIAASCFGDFPIGEDYKLWLEDRAFRSTFKKLSPISPYSEERKWTLKEFSKYVRKLPGSMAECGCYQGASAYFMAQENPDTPLHLFDSFEGLSRPNSADSPDKGKLPAWNNGDLNSTIETTQQTLKEFQNIVYHKGWIPEKFKDVKDKQFRLVHIDVDLYQPTYDSIDFFYPLLSTGGVIILDDYGFTTCPGAFKATIDFLRTNNIDTHVLMLPTGQGILFKE